MDQDKINNLRPSARHKLVAQLAQSAEKSLSGSLPPVDYGHYLLHSLDLKSIITTLSHTYPQTRCLAGKAFAKAWLLHPPDETIAIIGGATGLADILNEIAYKEAKILSQRLGHEYRGPNDLRTHALDALVALLVPAIAKDHSIHPVSRLGSTLATMFLPAVSPATASELLKFVSRRDARRLRHLLYTQPAYVAEFLQAEHGTDSNRDIYWQIEDLTKLFAMPSVCSIPAQKGEHWGIDLLVKLLITPTQPLLNFHPDVAGMVTMASAALQNAPNQIMWMSVMDALLMRSEVELKAGRNADFTKWRKIIPNITDKMVRFPSNSPEMETLNSYLQRIGKLAYPSSNAGIALLVPRLPRAIREDTMRSLHCLADGVEWTFPEDAHRVGISTVMYLKSVQGRPILRRMEPHFDMNQLFHPPESLPLPIVNLTSHLASQPADRDDAISVAVQGRWAYLEGDLEGQKQTDIALERWKRLVHRQKQAEARLQYIKALLTIAAVVGDTKTFKETFAWVFERFYKDVDVRPGIFQSYMTSCVNILSGQANKLEATAQDGDETIGLLIDVMSKARTEPNFQKHEFTSTTELCRQVLWTRLLLCQKHSISDPRTESVISPLKHLFLRVEMIVLEDPGTFGKPPRYPERQNNGWCDEYTIDLYPSYRKNYRRILVKFMDDLGRTRDALYADVRSTLEVGVDDGGDSDKSSVKTSNTEYPYDVMRFQYAWPYAVTASTFKDLSLETDAPFLYAFLHKIVYTPLEKVGYTEEDACYEQWNNAMELYVGCANTDNDRDAALKPLIQYYRTKAVSQGGVPADLSIHLVGVSSFMDAVQRSEALMEDFFSPYITPSTDQNQLKVFFGTPDPESKNYEKDINLSLFRRRRGGASFRDMMTKLSSVSPRRGSHRLRRQFAILSVVLWIHSLKGRDEADRGYKILANERSKLDFASIYSNSALPDNGNLCFYRSELESQQRMIISGIDQFTTAELQNIIKTVKSLISRTKNQPHRDAALRKLAMCILPCSHVPTLMEEDIFEVLADNTRSSLHRGFFNGSLLSSLRPAESKRLTQRFFALVSDLISRKPDVESKGPHVKISTIKYLAASAAQPFTGFSIEETYKELDSIANQQPHPSIQDALLSEATGIIVREGRLRRQTQLDTIWKLLETLALVACSLDETRQLTENDWSKPALPEIALNNRRPALIMKVRIDTLPVEVRSRWALMIEGMLAHQVQQTTRWLNEFFKRRKASAENLEFMNTIEFGPLLSCLFTSVAESYKMFYQYLPGQSWHLRILQSQVSSYLITDKLTAISTRFETVEPDWKRAQDGRDFTSLLAVWPMGQSIAFRTLVSILQKNGSEDVRNSLQVVLQDLLSPSAMLISVGNHLRRSTPWEVLRGLLWTLKPAERMTEKENEEWKNHIRPLVEWMVERAQNACMNDDQNQPLYTGLLSQIKSLYLPFPFMFPGDISSHSTLASQIYDLALEALQQPPVLSFLDEFLGQIFSQIIGLATNYVAVAKCLVQRAETKKDGDKDAFLLGYRLALYFTNRHDLDRDQQKQVKSIMAAMESHRNAMVRMLALSRSRTLADAEYSANALAGVYIAPFPPSLGYFRGRARGRGRPGPRGTRP